MDILGLLLKFYICTLAAQATGRSEGETAISYKKRCKVKDTQLLLSCAQVKKQIELPQFTLLNWLHTHTRRVEIKTIAISNLELSV